MDLFCPSAVQSYGGNFYTLVIVDDYSRYTWTRFLKHENEAFDHFEILSKKIQVQKGCLIISIRADHGQEFDNKVQFGAFCDANSITHNFSALRTPQSNGAVEHYLTIFDLKSTEGIFLGYSPNSKAYIILNKETIKVKESLNVKFDESPPPKSPPLEDDDTLKCEIIENKEKDLEIKENEPLNIEIINIKESKDHPLETIIEPKNVKEAIQDESWTMAMKEELNQFKTNDVWSRVPPPENQTIIGTSQLRLWYPKRTGVETIVYADSDYAGDYVDRKSTSGVCSFMRCCLTSWFSKKQTDLAISTTEAEYLSAGKAYQQALWMKQALVDYDINLDDIPVLCDNKSAIHLSKNPVLHSHTKHIEIQHHFLCDNVQKGNISIEKVSSEDNIADILTKPLKREFFNLLRLGLGLGLMEPNA
ncbi:copia protein [Tanacetum coccineum]